MKKVHDLTGDELLDELGVELEGQEIGGYTARQERLIAGFEDVLRFYETHGHASEHDQNRDIFERLYAVRLDQLRKLPAEELAVLLPLDKSGLLTGKTVERVPKALADDELLAELDEDGSRPDDIGVLRYVRDPEARSNTAAADQQVAVRRSVPRGTFKT